MKITQQTINGEMPVKLKELRHMADNYFDYDLTLLDVSKINDFSYLFEMQTDFNQDISNWDVSNGTNFSNMFLLCKYFNQNISNWNVSSGVNFSGMFYYAKSFDQDISKWDVSNGIDFMYMFNNAESFNQPIGKWSVSKGIDFHGMFISSSRFNQNISDWDVSNGNNFNAMFLNASSFNQNIIWTIKKEYLVQILKSNFNISIQYEFEKIGFTENADQLSLIFKDSPDSPFFNDFNYKEKELYLIKSNNFHGFMDKNNNAYQIDTNKITIKELIDICDIKMH